MIEFASVVEKARLIDPAGQAVEQTIEHRTDPLTSGVASINVALSEKAKAFFLGATDPQMLRDLQEKTRAECPFCNVATKGTRFPADFVAEGQLRIGKCTGVPNLFSKTAVDAVAIVDPARHVLFPSQVATQALADATRVSCEIIRRARRRDPALVHHVVGMNFLAPAGSSVPHPHYQTQVRAVPYSGLSRVIALARDFAARTGRNYWEALLEAEKSRGTRFIGATGRVQWLAAWAPAHQREIWGVLPGVASLEQISDTDADAFAEGVARVISWYESLGNHPFNFSFFSSPDPGAADHFALHLKVCSRPSFRPLYSNYDTWSMPKMFGDDVHTDPPERWAEALRGRWGA